MRTVWRSLAIATVLLGASSRIARADTDFQPGTLIIPMDSCGQLATTPSYCNWSSGSCSCPTRASCSWEASGYPSGSIKLPFGVLYVLATHGIPVSIALSDTKSTFGDSDFTISAPNSSTVPATVLTWSSSTTNPLDNIAGTYVAHDSYITTGTTSIAYGGGPMIVDAAYAQEAMRILSKFNRLDSTFTGVVIHMAYNSFTAPVGAVLQTRPRPVGINTSALDDFFGETGINHVMDLNAPCTTDSQCSGATDSNSTVSGRCNTSKGYCYVDYWVKLTYTNNTSAANAVYSFTRTSSMPQPSGACTSTSCSQLTYDAGGGQIDRLLDVIWMDQLGTYQDWVNWGNTSYGLDSFLSNYGRLFGIGSVGDQIEGGPGTRRYLTGTSSLGTDGSSGADHGPFCPVWMTDSTTTSTTDATSTPFPASNPFLQTGGLLYEINGGGGGVPTWSVAGPNWDSSTVQGLVHSGQWGAVSGQPLINGKRSGYVIYEGAVNSWHGNASHKDAGLRIMYNTLLDFNGEPGAATNRFTTTELSRSSITGSPTDPSKYYGGTFTWGVPTTQTQSGNNYWTPPMGAYPSTTGHYREYTTNTTAGSGNFGGDCTATGSPCSWDVAHKLLSQSGSRRVGVVDLTSASIKLASNSSFSSDGAISYMNQQLGTQLGGVDYSTSAIIQSKQKPVNLGNSQNRPTLAYFGARDGLLHAVCVTGSTQALTSSVDNSTAYASGTCYGASPGQEVWAILPRVAHRTMPSTNTSLSDWTSVNVGGIMRVADINTTPASTSTWRTVLFFTTRTAKSGVNDSVVALDISDPDPLNIGATTPVSLKVLWENDGAVNYGSATTGAGCSSYTGGCAMGASAGGTLAQVGSAFYLVVTSATASTASGAGINTYLMDASNGNIIGFNQMLYNSATRGGLTNQPTLAPINSFVNAPIPNDVPPLPTVLNPTLGGTDDTIVLVADPSGLVRRFSLPSGVPSTVSSTTNGLANIVTMFSSNTGSQSYSNSSGAHTYSPGCPTVNGVSNTACQPIGASVSIIKDGATSPNFFAIVATGGADWASSDPINRANTQFYVHYLDPQGSGPTSTNGGTTWTTTSTNGLKNVVALPGQITVPNTNLQTQSLRVYGQPSISGNDIFLQATTLAQNSEVQLVQPIMYPDYPSGCTGAACTRYWGRGVRIASADQNTAAVDNTTFVTTASGMGAVYVATTGTGSSPTVTAYFMGTNQVYSVTSASTGASSSTYAIRQSTSTNYNVKAWLGLD